MIVYKYNVCIQVDTKQERDSGQGNERTCRRRRTTGCSTRIALGSKEINEPNINQQEARHLHPWAR